MSETLTGAPVTPPELASLQMDAGEGGRAPIAVPAEFQAVTALMHEEQVLETREDLKAEAAAALSPALEALTAEEVPNFLSHINTEYPGVFAGQDLCLLSASRENLVMVNTHGELVEVPVTAENAADVLTAIKRADAEGKKGHSYGLRHEILKRSEGSILSHDAYTYAEELPRTGLDAYLDEPESWVPERRKLHGQIVESELAKAHSLSERLDDDTPTIYALRGNTAAGKTTAVRSEPTFAKALDGEGEPSGSINPDIYKAILKESEVEGVNQTVSHFQAHEEGSMLAREISKHLTQSESSMVIDKRMAKTKNLTELITTAEASGRDIKILDVDVPLELSLVRVLGREIGGESPNVPFDAVAEGFRDIRASRVDILDKVRQDAKITEYVLRVTDESGALVEVARKTGSEHIEVTPGREDLLRASVDAASSEETIQRLAETVITDEYIEGYIARIHADDPTGNYAQAARAALARYKGQTLKEALDQRAATLNENQGEK